MDGALSPTDLVRCEACGCGKNLAWWRWCKHCRGPLVPSAQPPRQAPKAPRKPAGRSPARPAGADGGGSGVYPWHYPTRRPPSRDRRPNSRQPRQVGFDLRPEVIGDGGVAGFDKEEQRLVQLVDLLTESGDTAAASSYKQKLEDYRSSKIDDDMSLELAKARVDRAEATLRRSIEKCEQLEAQAEQAQREVEQHSEEVDAARTHYQAAVRKLHTIVIADEAQGQSEPSVPKIDLAKLLDGQDLVLDDGNMFGLEDLGDVVSNEDREEALRRKELLQKELKTAIGNMFGPLREKAAALGKEQQQLQERLAKKKRKTGDGDEEGAPAGAAGPTEPAKQPAAAKPNEQPPGEATPGQAEASAAPAAAAAAPAPKVRGATKPSSVVSEAKAKLEHAAAKAAATGGKPSSL